MALMRRRNLSVINFDAMRRVRRTANIALGMIAIAEQSCERDGGHAYAAVPLQCKGAEKTFACCVCGKPQPRTTPTLQDRGDR